MQWCDTVSQWNKNISWRHCNLHTGEWFYFNLMIISMNAIALTISIFFIPSHSLFTPPRNHEIVEGLYFHCSLSVCVFVCVCVCVCVRHFACEQNSRRTDAPIWTRFSLNGCLLYWLEPYWNLWPWVKGQGHSDSFLHTNVHISNSTDSTTFFFGTNI